MATIDFNQIIMIQWPIVFLLFTLSLLIARTVDLREFRLFAFAWLFNFLYLVANFAFKGKSEEVIPKMLIVLLDLTSTYFFILTLYNTTMEFRFQKRLKLFKPYQIAFILLVAGIWKAWPDNPKDDQVPYIIVRNVIPTLIDAGTFMLLAFYFKSLARKLHLSLLTYGGFFLYSLIQVIALLQEDSFYLNDYLNIQFVGFTVGLISKIFIFAGLIYLLPTGQEYANKKNAASRLDEILGKTFHEIRYPLKSMNAVLSKLLPNDDDKMITNRNEIMDKVRLIDSSFNHLAAIIGASYKLYETDIGKPIDNPLIRIPEFKLETVSVNTIIQIAILRIKPFTSEKVDFDCEFASSCYIDCHSYQLVQVFLNLFKNSFEAFDNNKGSILIRTRVRTNEYEFVGQSKAIEISIEDDGPGISIEIIDKIFEQGFTTKPSKEKRGFGLNIVREVIESNNGKIFVNPDKPRKLSGANFYIVFPQAKVFPKRD